MLRFNSDHKFKIMQIADTQEIPAVSPDTLSLINNALDREKPDLVIFTGDQIKGYSKKFKKDPAIIESTIDILVEPIAKRNIPFMVTYGNHDAQCGVDNRGQYKFYAKYDNFISGDLRNSDDVGTADIQIYSSTEDKPVFELYIIDSHGKAKDGAGYAPVDKKQIEWYVSRREQLNDETIAEGGFMLESPASPDVNTGEFEAMSEKGDVLGIYVGHDHNNSFVVKYKGVDLGYTQGAGFNVYGPGENRGVRIFELDETAPREYKTYTATFKELCGTKIKTPVKEFIYKHAPTSPRAVKPILIKVGIGIAAIAAVYAAYKFFTGFNI